LKGQPTCESCPVILKISLTANFSGDPPDLGGKQMVNEETKTHFTALVPKQL